MIQAVGVQVYRRGEPDCETGKETTAMVMHGCVKEVLDDSKYSSPVQVIGLYIAAASMVCFMAMLHDIVSGVRQRKRWLPCQWFSLDSVTLTLLGVAAKIPLDLTTPMPSALDQISKLSGTTFLCISMAFLMPSVGMKQTSECVTNMVALTIFVVTVVVNICIQIHTGVIFLLIPEHITIMCCMIAFVIVLWVCVVAANSEKGESLDCNKDIIMKGKGSMLERLKVAYLYAFNYSPQIIICRNIELHEATGLCVICSVTFTQAALKSLAWECRRGSSDYDWSMSLIVLMQILTVVLGSLGSCIRYFAFSSQVKLDASDRFVYASSQFEMLNNPLLHVQSRVCFRIVYFFSMFIVVLVHMLVLWPFALMCFLIRNIFRLCFKLKREGQGDIKIYKDLIGRCYEGGEQLQEWILVKSIETIKRCVDVNQSEGSWHLLHRLLPAELPQASTKLQTRHHKVSSLSMVVLVRIAQVSIPSAISGSLVKLYREAYQVIHFVEDRLLPLSFKTKKESALAKAVWLGKDFSEVLPKNLDNSINDETISQSQFELHRALVIIQALKTALPSDTVWKEVGRIVDIIMNRDDYSSVESLYRLIEELFLEMLHQLLVELPHAIYKEVTESSAEDFDERVRLCLEILCKVQSLEAHIQWSFPAGCNISCLMTSRYAATPGQNPTVEESCGDDARTGHLITGDVINNMNDDIIVDVVEISTVSM